MKKLPAADVPKIALYLNAKRMEAAGLLRPGTAVIMANNSPQKPTKSFKQPKKGSRK
jgi:hypothetical protein